MATVKVLIVTSVTRNLTDQVCTPTCNHAVLENAPKSSPGMYWRLCKNLGGVLRNKFLLGCFSEGVKCLPLSFSKLKFKSWTIILNYFIAMKKADWNKNSHKVIRAGSKHLQNNAWMKTLAGFLFAICISALLHRVSPFDSLGVPRPICNSFSPLLVPTYNSFSPLLTQMFLYLTYTFQNKSTGVWASFFVAVVCCGNSPQTWDNLERFVLKFTMHQSTDFVLPTRYQAAQVAKIFLQNMKILSRATNHLNTAPNKQGSIPCHNIGQHHKGAFSGTWELKLLAV